MLLKKYEHNPILTPTKNKWESKHVLNCGACKYKNKIYLLYRAIGEDNISRFGLAVSKDGYTIDERFPEPIYEPKFEFEKRGVEDPRITKIGNTYYIVYSGFWDILDGDNRTRIILAKTRNFKNFKFSTVLRGENNKDGALFPKKFKGKHILIHRRMPNIWIGYSEDFSKWENHKILMRVRENKWDSLRIGAGPPPVKTKQGWLMIYHGTDNNDVYRLGAAMLDIKNPAVILKRLDEPILEPSEPWEKVGLVNNVVFSCGMVQIKNKYFVYYGGGDSYIGVATVDKKELLKRLK
jgi:beta-1,2-mannobiose phosphorylase / 1,2-beta-oligomannan phosphorylase